MRSCLTPVRVVAGTLALVLLVVGMLSVVAGGESSPSVTSARQLVDPVVSVPSTVAPTTVAPSTTAEPTTTTAAPTTTTTSTSTTAVVQTTTTVKRVVTGPSVRGADGLISEFDQNGVLYRVFDSLGVTTYYNTDGTIRGQFNDFGQRIREPKPPTTVAVSSSTTTTTEPPPTTQLPTTTSTVAPPASIGSPAVLD